MAAFEQANAQIRAHLQEAERARAYGRHEQVQQHVREAARILLIDLSLGRQAIDLLIRERDYAPAAEIAAEHVKDWKLAAELWFHAGEIHKAACARIETNEPMLAAELFERCGDFSKAAAIHEATQDFIRAAVLYEKGGDKQRAADLLVRALSATPRRVVGVEADEACRRAGVLYAQLGQIEHAVKILRWGKQNVFAGHLLARAGRTEEAIELLSKSGDLLAAAEIARASGNETRAHLLLGERAEREGRFAEAAGHFERAESFLKAARDYEYAKQNAKAAENYERSGQLDSAAELYEQNGRLADAKRVFEAAGRNAEAAALEDRSDRREESVRRHIARGELLRAAEVKVARARNGEHAQYHDAVKLLTSVSPEHPTYWAARSLLAEILAEQGDAKGGINVLQALLAGVKPAAQYLPTYYHYARLLELDGFLASARHAYFAIISVDPTFRDVANRLAQLRESDTQPRFMRTQSEISAVPVAPLVSGTPFASPSPAPASIPSAPMTSGPRAAPRGATPLPSAPPRTASTTSAIPQATIASAPPTSAPAAAPSRPLRPEAGALILEPGLVVDRGEAERLVNAPGMLEGVVLRSRFRIEREIGHGAQAHVYLARDLVLDRPVAIKVLNESFARDVAALDRFLREARLAARVRHASCLAIFDFGQERGVIFMAMEYFKGVTLRDRLAASKLAPLVALRIAKEIAEALAAVHEAGIVHRDVKPTNVMVDERESARLTDFGVAHVMNEQVSSTGVMVGTMKYMAPEQARGQEVDRRADVFSLGAVLFEMLAGEPPFEGSLDALIRRVGQPPPRLPAEIEVPELVGGVISKCMQGRPDGRYERVEPLIEDLRRCIDLLEQNEKAKSRAGAAMPSDQPSDVDHVSVSIDLSLHSNDLQAPLEADQRPREE